MESFKFEECLSMIPQCILEMHADVIAGRQINQTLNRILDNLMNKYV